MQQTAVRESNAQEKNEILTRTVCAFHDLVGFNVPQAGPCYQIRSTCITANITVRKDPTDIPIPFTFLPSMC